MGSIKEARAVFLGENRRAVTDCEIVKIVSDVDGRS
jgi:hypothetical protein